MPRGPVSRADQELISALAERGVVVSPYQLEAWRRRYLIPRNVRHGLGRGRGSVSALAPDTLPKAEMVGRYGPRPSAIVWYAANAMATGYDRPVPLVRDLLYSALHQALYIEDTTLQARDDGVDPVDRACADAEGEFWLNTYIYGLPKSQRSAYVQYLTASKVGVAEVGRELLEPRLLELGFATEQNLPEVVSFLESNFREADDKFDRLGGPDIATLLLRLGLAGRLLQVLGVIDVDQPAWHGPITKQQVDRFVHANLNWISNFSWGANRMLMIAVHMAHDADFLATVTDVLGEDTAQGLGARIRLDEYGAIVRPLDALDQHRLVKNRANARCARYQRFHAYEQGNGV